MNLFLYDTKLTEFEGGEGFEFDFRVFKMHIARSRVTKSFFHLLSLHLIPSQVDTTLSDGTCARAAISSGLLKGKTYFFN
ncbi:hypothetical protein HanPI659440_Chr09g0352951 [Helianthus annuus]|nr:hypothetical protein HanPI659440_Chr09g0352951 [Helianthus annuus]